MRTRRWLIGLVLAALALFVSPATAEPPSRDGMVAEGGYLIETINPKKDDLRLFWADGHGQTLRDFTGLEKFVAAQGEKLLFAANAGMFQPDSRPVGLLVQDGNETNPLNLGDGAGNFYMKPNGVFLINEKREAMVVESSSYAALLTPVVWATQSGPLLVNEGSISPDFRVDSVNRKIRSGVGVRKDGTVVLALSTRPVNFYEFALAFKDRWRCPNALYLDGEISAFHGPGDKENPGQHSFGPLFGLVTK